MIHSYVHNNIINLAYIQCSGTPSGNFGLRPDNFGKILWRRLSFIREKIVIIMYVIWALIAPLLPAFKFKTTAALLCIPKCYC